ncbi:unnamed protein product [Didymodactylos carnosus]|uniref:Uncharacterized protein n=1 Tax=Didymodactylos carnosus TaxID=1234261 RepID=A0A814U4C6_9BILA|nr:unnamed protein product [Didymodactylos carnosus]CAF1273399.1 unnamed protein product [Didymodactylos carnosus]CAF3933675.1 unnamed protein product [Didymodactylos carnosus]CAF4078646.1 unnamed protein product [Didymodactylos carnosus]
MDTVTRLPTFSKITELDQRSKIDREWRNLILAGPCTINLLGQLMVVSSKLDFRLDDNEPKGGFQYIKHPSSFRATLVQISHDGYKAFMFAHSSMNKIQMYMKQIPEHVTTALEIISTGTPRMLKTILPQSLNFIESIGKECMKLANDTHHKFEITQYLISEVISSTVAAEKVSIDKRDEIIREKNDALLKKSYLQNITTMVYQRYNETKVNLEKAEERYKIAMNEMPTGWNAVRMRMVQHMDQTTKILVDSLQSYLAINTTSSIPTSLPGIVLKAAESFAFTIIKPVQSHLSQIVGTIDHVVGKKKNIRRPEQDTLKQFLNGKNILSILQDLIKDTGTPDDDKNKKMLQSLIKTSILTIEDLIKTLNQSSSIETDKIHGLRTKLATIIHECEPYLVAEQLKNSEGDAMTTTIGDDTYINQLTNEKLKALLEQKLLELAEKQRQKMYEAVILHQEKMYNLMQKIAGLNIQHIDYNQLIDLLDQSHSLLSQISEQWSYFVSFFSQIQTRAEVEVRMNVEYFNTAANSAKNGWRRKQEQSVHKRQLNTKAISLYQCSHILYAMANTYMDISENYFIHQLAGLSKLISIKSDDERSRVLKQLVSGNNQTQEKIRLLSIKRNRDYDNQIRIEKGKLKVVLSRMKTGKIAKERKIIKSAVQIYENQQLASLKQGNAVQPQRGMKTLHIDARDSASLKIIYGES